MDYAFYSDKFVAHVVSGVSSWEFMCIRFDDVAVYALPVVTSMVVTKEEIPQNVFVPIAGSV